MSIEVPPEEVAECPACRASVALDAKGCPSCGEPFPDEIAQEDDAEAFASRSGSTDVPSRRTASSREKLLFYVGILLMLLGGPGIALGSWLHDVLHISVMNYDAFTVFGPMNRLVVTVGLVVTIVGIVLFILSLRLARPSPEEIEIHESQET